MDGFLDNEIEELMMKEWYDTEGLSAQVMKELERDKEKNRSSGSTDSFTCNTETNSIRLS